MDTPVQYKRFSAEVRIELRAEGSVFDLAAAGPNEVTLRQPAELPPCDAEVVMFINGKGLLWPIRLRHGIVPYEKHVKITPRGEMQRL